VGAVLILLVSPGRGGDGTPVPVTGEEGSAALCLMWRARLAGERAQWPAGRWRRWLSLLGSDQRRKKGWPGRLGQKANGCWATKVRWAIAKKRKLNGGGWSLWAEKGKEIGRMFTNFWLLQLELNQKNFELKPKEIFQS
jgi:hypothetical protein